MAHARSTDNDALLIEQCSRGRRVRYIYPRAVIVAADRTAQDADSSPVADVIDGETALILMFVAPCDGKFVRGTVNASTYPVTSGAATVTFYKTVSGGDTALTAAININNPTAETAIDGTLVVTSGVTDLVEGQIVYASIAVSATTSAKSSALGIEAEFVPVDLSY